MYESVADAERYLKGSLIRLGKDPIIITGVLRERAKIILECSKLDKDLVRTALITEEDLDFSPVPLGYGAARSHLSYFSRTPSRMWKQGLHPKNLKVFGDLPVGDFYDRRTKLILHSVIKGRKTSYERAFLGNNGGIINRKFAIHPHTRSFNYKGMIVGVSNQKEVALLPEFSYLDKYIEEVVHVSTSVL